MRTTRSHTYRHIENGVVTEYPKKGYNCESDAIAAANRINAFGHEIHKMVAYQCIRCNKWHIGHNWTIMTDEHREEAKEKIKKENKI